MGTKEEDEEEEERKETGKTARGARASEIHPLNYSSRAFSDSRTLRVAMATIVGIYSSQGSTQPCHHHYPIPFFYPYELGLVVDAEMRGKNRYRCNPLHDVYLSNDFRETLPYNEI